MVLGGPRWFLSRERPRGRERTKRTETDDRKDRSGPEIAAHNLGSLSFSFYLRLLSLFATRRRKGRATTPWPTTPHRRSVASERPSVPTR